MLSFELRLDASRAPSPTSTRGLALVAALLASCTDAPLEPTQPEGPPPVDRRLAVRGSVCSEIPADGLFPVKILFIIDTSFSMRVTDPAQQRVRAIQQVLERYAGNPSVKFGVIAFDATVTDVTRGFTSNPNFGTVSARLDDSDRLTDYQGALGRAYAMLTEDLLRSSPGERARSKYVVIFFSDGIPDPQCNADQPPLFQGVCNVDREEWPEVFDLPQGTNPNTGMAWTWEDFQGLYPELDAGKDYNSVAQLTAKVEDILSLQEIYNVNEIRFHSAFLFDPNIDPAFIEAFNLDRARGGALLRDMATAGNGTYSEFTSGNEINFLNINYVSVKQNYELARLIAFDRSTVPGPRGALVDSDGDGLSDLEEDELRLCASPIGGAACNRGGGDIAEPDDTDGDGYTDFFEHRFRSAGFDPRDPDAPATACSDSGDADGDRLRDCEEAFLGTDSRLFDTDVDRIPDGLELRFGLNPKDARDALGDDDADGLRNADEVLAGWSPRAREPLDSPPIKIQYDITRDAVLPDGRTCYTFDIRGLELQTTRGVTSETRGRNRIDIQFLEAPPDDPRDFGSIRSACVEARYIEPDFKLPVNGFVELSERDFFPLGDPSQVCVGAGR